MGILPVPPVSRAQRLEDNAFVLLRAKDGGIVQFHTSWTQWVNRFSFEVFGRAGCVAVEGLGGSYRSETLAVSRRRNEGGKPEQEIETFAGPDDSWRLEWQEFVSAISEGRHPWRAAKTAWRR